jgi:hypothetical protein
MLQQLRAASSDWGQYRAIPLNVTAPEETLISPISLAVVGWPAQQIAQWAAAWEYLAGTLLKRAGSARKFPLGDPATLYKSYQLAITSDASTTAGAAARGAAAAIIMAAPTINDAVESCVGLLTEVKDAFGVGEKKQKPWLNKTTIIGLLLVAAAGGSLMYYYRRKDQNAHYALPVPSWE